MSDDKRLPQKDGRLHVVPFKPTFTNSWEVQQWELSRSADDRLFRNNKHVSGMYVVPDLSADYFRKDLSTEILKSIDKFALDKWNDGFRKHLGASLIGNECVRQTWYSWRWMALPAHSGRMQRLFRRGHLEEHRYEEYLKGIGAEVWTVDTTKPKKLDGTYPQFRVSRVNGHFGGSLDGIVRLKSFNIAEPMLAEFKTKKDGSDFTKLKEKGIMLTNPQHYDQMCTYGWNYNFRYSLYMSTNKNTDDMHVEIVPLNWARAAEVEKKAEYVIAQQTPPPRLSMNETHWKCKACDFLAICHHNRMPVKNCRSCVYATPAENAMWYCNGHKALIPDEVIDKGCPHWTAIASPK